MKSIKILALALGAAFVTPLAASAQPMGMYFHGPARHIVGRIASVNGGSFQLLNGRTIFLRPGTVITPVGRPLRPGQRVDIHGFGAGNGAVNARYINILPRY
jgi:hypothetical protein